MVCYATMDDHLGSGDLAGDADQKRIHWKMDRIEQWENLNRPDVRIDFHSDFQDVGHRWMRGFDHVECSSDLYSQETPC